MAQYKAGVDAKAGSPSMGALLHKGAETIEAMLEL